MLHRNADEAKVVSGNALSGQGVNALVFQCQVYLVKELRLWRESEESNAPGKQLHTVICLESVSHL
jgi:hypothetical protein